MWCRSLLISLCLISCHRTEAPGSGAPTSATGTILRGQVFLTTQTYCGGARPPEDMELSKRSPEPGKRLLVRRGSENTEAEVLAQVTADGSGSFVLSLPPGTYCFIEEAKRALSAPAPENTDPGCLQNWRRTCDAVVEVPKTGEVPVTLEFHKGCFHPCSQGPFPP